MSKAQSTQKQRLTKRELYEQHWDEWKPIAVIAREYNWHPTLLRRHCDEMGMIRRGENFESWLYSMFPKRAFYEWYWSELLSVKEIGEIFGNNDGAVTAVMREHGIPIRDKGDDVDHPTDVALDFMEVPHRSRVVLHELLNERRLSQSEAAEELGVNSKTVAKWAHRNNIYSY